MIYSLSAKAHVAFILYAFVRPVSKQKPFGEFLVARNNITSLTNGTDQTHLVVPDIKKHGLKFNAGHVKILKAHTKILT